MATAPEVPDLTQYNFDLGDTDAAVTKDNGRNAAIDKFAEDLEVFSSEASQEQSDTLSQAQTLKQDTISQTESIKQSAVSETTTIKNAADTAKNDAVAAKNSAQQAANDAEAIVYGDTLGDLQTILDEINGV